MIFCTDTHLIYESYNGNIIDRISITENSILPTITNKSVSTKLNQNNSHFISAARTKQPSDKMVIIS